MTAAENEVGNRAKPTGRLRLSINAEINARATAGTARGKNLGPLKLRKELRCVGCAVLQHPANEMPLLARQVSMG